MMLMKLRDYLKEKHAASLSDVSRHFDIPESATQGMLEHWVRKGYVVVDVGVLCSGSCGGCVSRSRCDGASMIYRWREGEKGEEVEVRYHGGFQRKERKK